MGTCDCKVSSTFKERLSEYVDEDPPPNSASIPSQVREYGPGNSPREDDTESRRSKSTDLISALNRLGSHISETRSLQKDSIEELIRKTVDIENHVQGDENGIVEEESSMYDQKLDMIHKEMSDLLKLVRDVANNQLFVKMGCAESQDGESYSQQSIISQEPGRHLSKQSRQPRFQKTLSTLGITIESFRIEKVIGRGACGKVMLVRKKDSGQMYAMKVLKKEMIQRMNQRKGTLNERQILEGAKDHPYIVQLRFAFQTADKLYFVMDFMPGGELFFHLQHKGRFTEEQTAFYAAEILLAIEYMHNKGIIYRDLKPENILMDQHGHVCIADFGVSQVNFDSDKLSQSFVGSPYYLAPEMINKAGHGQAVDYWALGVLIYEMLSGCPPFYNENQRIMFDNITMVPAVMKPYFSEDTCDLLKQLLEIDPVKRLCMADSTKSHPFFIDIDWKAMENMEVKPPLVPSLRDSQDLSYFDTSFLEEAAVDTPQISKLSYRAKLRNHYEGFTYKDEMHV